ncbi:MAG: hypothetical protein LBS68_00805 [Puniceicoccales bacterium]|nr:hypothetical protein [Puniceicoccales bacterium]
MGARRRALSCQGAFPEVLAIGALSLCRSRTIAGTPLSAGGPANGSSGGSVSDSGTTKTFPRSLFSISSGLFFPAVSPANGKGTFLGRPSGRRATFSPAGSESLGRPRLRTIAAPCTDSPATPFPSPDWARETVPPAEEVPSKEKADPPFSIEFSNVGMVIKG